METTIQGFQGDPTVPRHGLNPKPYTPTYLEVSMMNSYPAALLPRLHKGLYPVDIGVQGFGAWGLGFRIQGEEFGLIPNLLQDLSILECHSYAGTKHFLPCRAFVSTGVHLNCTRDEKSS